MTLENTMVTVDADDGRDEWALPQLTFRCQLTMSTPAITVVD